MRICVLIPIHNEIREIGRLVAAIRKMNLEVVVVDDGSTDGSGEAARREGAAVLVNPEKQGKGRSLQKGFAHALQESFDGVITMDGDGQHDPEDLEAFLNEIVRHPQGIITGSRMAHPKGMPLVRLWTNFFMSFWISLVCGQKVPDTQCGFRYVSADVLKNITLTANDFEIETEVLIKASRRRYPIFSMPIKTIYRDEESKIHPFKDTARFFIYMIKEMRTTSR